MLWWFAGTYLGPRTSDPWILYALLAAIASVVITVRPAGKMQAAIGGAAIASLICHISYGLMQLMEIHINLEQYYFVLERLVIVRFAMFGAWVVGSLAGFGYHWFRRHHALADRPHPQSMV